jgi:hypothetical protein
VVGCGAGRLRGAGDRGGVDLACGGFTVSVVCVVGDFDVCSRVRQTREDHEILFAQNAGYCVKYKKRGVLS